MKIIKSIGSFIKSTTRIEKFILLLPASFLTILDSMKYSLIALVIMITIDLITALCAYFNSLSKRLKRKLKFKDYRYGLKSGGLRNTFIKLYQYFFAIFAVFILEVFAFRGEISFNVPLIDLNAGLTEFVIWALTMIELKSIDENFRDSSGNSILSKITGIFKYLKNLLLSFKDLKKESNLEEEN